MIQLLIYLILLGTIGILTGHLGLMLAVLAVGTLIFTLVGRSHYY